MKSTFILPSDTFYNSVSDFYEKMIDFEKNLELRKGAYQRIFSEKGISADIGCGIGLDSIALALNGHDVTAFDISPKMIEEVKKNSIKYKVDIEAQTHSFASLPKSYNGKFNNVVSVGNTIAHLDNGHLKKAIKKIYNLLLPGGKVFLHILNYGLLKKENRRINNIASRDGKVIIRFYDFRKNDLDFNILSFQQNSPKDFQLVTTKHFPHTKNEIKFYLETADFGKIKFMKNFAGDKFNSGSSKDMFIEAVKKL
ncbi:MAG: class I SAM-dependent methyltransferase [Melioribacteraceae bacterium]